MSTVLVLVVVFSAVALGLSAFALWASLGARQTAREAHDAVRAVAAHAPRRKPADPDDDRREDLGPRARHRADDDRYPRLRASAEQREQEEPPTTAIPRIEPEQLATAEHPSPTGRFRQPPPPLPPPGPAIGRRP